jgi:putative ABC transport system ATP-binding protein
MSVINLEHVYYSYDGDNHVLKDINFEFEKGKMYAIIGRSGSGKTTLLSLISGLEKCKDGTIYYNDRDISKMDNESYRSKHIGIVFQSFNLLSHLTAIENIILAMDISGSKYKEKEKQAIKLLERVGIDEAKGRRRVLKLSGGEQQRVAIARSLSYNPDVILADEPTGNLDSHNEEQIISIFRDLVQNDNKCVIIVTHSKTMANSVDVVYDLKPNK